MAKKILYTNGNVIDASVRAFESYDVIRYSASYPDSPVSLRVTNGGTLNLASELGGVDATISASNKAIVLTSGTGDDKLTGGAGNDSLNGGAGIDTLVGGSGKDTLRGGLGADTLDGGDGNDKLYGGDGDDFFRLSGINNGVDAFSGGAGTDTLYIDDDTTLTQLVIKSTSSVERIDVNYYRTLSGTTGSDSFDISGITGYTTGGDYGNVIHLAEGNDRYIGSQVADRVYGDEGKDTLQGGLGGDVINGGAGNDQLFGDDGDDFLVLSGSDNGVDSFNGGAGTDTLYIGDDTTLTQLVINGAASVERLDLNYYRPLSGTTGNDSFDISGITGYTTGGDYGNVIRLAEGNDSYIGSQVADQVYGDEGRDTLHGGLGGDSISGGAGNDKLFGDAGDDFLLLSGSNNGVDAFNGGAGIDTLYIGADTTVTKLAITSASSVERIDLNYYRPLSGTTGNDNFDISGITGYTTGGTYGNVIQLAEGNDTFIGSQAADNVYGNEGNDTLSAGLGDDEIHGGDGNDTLTGGSGGDTFVFETALNASTNVDTVTGFVSGTDSFLLSRSNFGSYYGTLAAQRFVEGTAAETADQRIVYDATSGKLYYDADGTGAIDAVQFAQVEIGTALANTDFIFG